MNSLSLDNLSPDVAPVHPLAVNFTSSSASLTSQIPLVYHDMFLGDSLLLISLFNWDIIEIPY